MDMECKDESLDSLANRLGKDIVEQRATTAATTTTTTTTTAGARVHQGAFYGTTASSTTTTSSKVSGLLLALNFEADRPPGKKWGNLDPLFVHPETGAIVCKYSSLLFLVVLFCCCFRTCPTHYNYHPLFFRSSFFSFLCESQIVVIRMQHRAKKYYFLMALHELSTASHWTIQIFMRVIQTLSIFVFLLRIIVVIFHNETTSKLL